MIPINDVIIVAENLTRNPQNTPLPLPYPIDRRNSSLHDSYITTSFDGMKRNGCGAVTVLRLREELDTADARIEEALKESQESRARFFDKAREEAEASEEGKRLQSWVEELEGKGGWIENPGHAAYLTNQTPFRALKLRIVPCQFHSLLFLVVVQVTLSVILL